MHIRKLYKNVPKCNLTGVLSQGHAADPLVMTCYACMYVLHTYTYVQVITFCVLTTISGLIF